MLILKILGAIAALALGVWLGLPGRYDQSQAEIDRALTHKFERSKRVNRHFTPLDWFRRERKGSDRRQERRRFRTSAPDRAADAES